MFRAYKYPICDVFHWLCKTARFFATEPHFVLVFYIDEESKSVILENYAHHDNIY
jgi:hypothetical protein